MPFGIAGINCEAGWSEALGSTISGTVDRGNVTGVHINRTPTERARAIVAEDARIMLRFNIHASPKDSFLL